MIADRLHLSNIKCGGCAHSIKTKLDEIEGIISTEVNVEEGTLETTYETKTVRENIVQKLAAMGYPEATAENGLLMQAKSYANCLLGKATK
jgi:copper chaperone CopZ